jgi:hypothetical protein
VRIDLTARARGVVFVDEASRSLGPRDVASVLGVPVLTTVPVRASTARAVDAGVLPPGSPTR